MENPQANGILSKPNNLKEMGILVRVLRTLEKLGITGHSEIAYIDGRVIITWYK